MRKVGGSPLPEEFLKRHQGPVCFSVELPGSLKLISPPAKKLSRRSEALNREALPHLSFCSECTLQETFVCYSLAQPLGFLFEHVRRGLKFESQPVYRRGAHPLPSFVILIAIPLPLAHRDRCRFLSRTVLATS